MEKAPVGHPVMGLKRALVGRVAVFAPDGAEEFLLDNVKLTLSPKHPYKFAGRKASCLDQEKLSALLGLTKAANAPALYPVDGQLVLGFSSGSIQVQQALGAVAGAHGRISRTLDLNPLRLVRDELVAAGRRVEILPSSRGDTNFVDPVLVPPAEVHQLCLAKLVAIVTAGLETYRACLATVFRLPLGRDEVQASINIIEVAWDRPTRAAALAPMIWQRPWFTLPRPARQPASLKAEVQQGSFLKLYPKTDHVLRFESQMRGEEVTERLGHRPDLLDAAALEVQLLRAASPDYEAMLEVQESLDTEGPLHHLDLIAALMPQGQGEVATSILSELVTARQVRSSAREQTKYRILTRLREAGLVRRGKARGLWVPTARLLHTLDSHDRHARAGG